MIARQYFCSKIMLALLAMSYNYTYGHAQSLPVDSVKILPGYMLVLGDSTLRFKNDTTIFIQKGSDYKIVKDKEYKSAEFYNNFKEKSDKNLLLKGLYGATVRGQKDTTVTENINENYFPEHEHKIVGKIDIMYVDIMDGDVNDTTINARSGLSKTLNKLHKDSRKLIIKRNLTIREGDVLGAYTISDNEYLLRSLNYIEDAKIYILPDSINQDTLNLLVVVKDIFPFAIGFGMGGVTDYTLELNNINILGSGNEFANSFRYDASKQPSFGYNGELSINNIYGSFVDFTALFKNNANEKMTSLTVERDFITPETRYGGGIELYNQQTSLTVETSDTTVAKIPYSKNYFDQWIGRSFLYNATDRKSVILKARYMATRFVRRPDVESDTNQQFYDINFLLGSVTLLRKNHFKEYMLLGFGIIEDIDYGYAVELTYGYQFSEYFEAPYAGLSLKGAEKFNFGFIGGGVEYGTHYYQNEPVHGLFRAGFTYYSPLFKANFFKYRLLTRWFYTEGIKRYPYETLNLGKEVRGISNSGVEGSKRLIARFELVTFLNYNVLGFRFSPNLFYDAAFLSSGSEVISSNNFYSGIGAGVRIRNENLAFQTIIIRFVYYTDNPVKSAHPGIGFTTSNPDLFKDYEINRPDILQY